MATRSYRVVERFPWIEGGRPAPGFGWEGGRDVVYEPGSTIHVDDEDLASIYRHLEATDDAGSAALEKLRAKAEAPARRTAVADLDPRAVEWIDRALDEKLRAQGRMSELCMRIIARKGDPAHEDLAAALESSEAPPPELLLQYVAKILRGEWRKPGRKAPPRTTDEDLFVQSLYWLKVEELQARFERKRQKRAPVKRRAAEEVAAELGLSVRTVERIVAPRPWTKTRKTPKT
jgi:hypothetical protein